MTVAYDGWLADALIEKTSSTLNEIALHQTQRKWWWLTEEKQVRHQKN